MRGAKRLTLPTPHRGRQPIRRGQFAVTFRHAAASLQLAALVAQTAEILRDSPFAQGTTFEGAVDVLDSVRDLPAAVQRLEGG